MGDVPYDPWLLVISLLFLGLASTFYPIYLCKVFNLRTRQPIRQKGPYLLLVSQISGYLMISVAMISLIVKCISTSEDNKSLNKPICYMGGIALLFLHPLFYLPYFLRGMRLCLLYRAQMGKLRRLRILHYFRQRYMMRIVIILAAVLAVLVVLMFVVSKFLYYNPLNFMPACQYAHGLDNPQQAEDALSIAAALWLSMFFVESTSLILLIYFVRNIQENFSIVSELTLLTAAWIVGNTSGLVLSIFWSSFEAGILIFDFILVLMFFFIFGVSVVQPVHATKNDLTIPFAEPSDILNDFPDVLYRPTPARYFFRYLERRFPEHLPYFELLNELVHFDHLVADIRFEEAIAHAHFIAQKFFRADSEHFTEFDDNVVDELNQQLVEELTQEALQRDENVFDPVRVRSEEKLLQCWNQFTESPRFQELTQELQQQELFYSAMRKATMISNQLDSTF